MRSYNSNLIGNKIVSFKAYDFLKFTGRSTCGRSYSNLRLSLERLDGARVKTNIKINERIVETFFSFIRIGKIISSIRSDGRKQIVSTEIELSDWIVNAVNPKQVLTINRDYFRLKPLEKSLYGLLRKHMGTKSHWKIRLDTVFRKLAIRSSIYEFRRFIKNTVRKSSLPDFRIQYCPSNDCVYVFSRTKKGAKAMLDWVVER